MNNKRKMKTKTKTQMAECGLLICISHRQVCRWLSITVSNSQLSNVPNSASVIP
jgi:hypothetical protein